MNPGDNKLILKTHKKPQIYYKRKRHGSRPGRRTAPLSAADTLHVIVDLCSCAAMYTNQYTFSATRSPINFNYNKLWIGVVT